MDMSLQKKVRQEAAAAVTKLTGIKDKDGLWTLLREMGLDKLGSSKTDEVCNSLNALLDKTG